jgi:hypothetical protein
MKHSIMQLFSGAKYLSIRSKVQAVVLSACFAITATSFLSAQSTTGDITGTVTDTTGASVPKATVTLTNLGTKEVRTIQSGDSGDYTFTQLGPGSYSVQIKETGFQTFMIPAIALNAGDRAREDAKLSVGSEATTITVDAQTPALQTDTSSISHTVTDQSVQDLPISGRNYINLVQITPGANEGPGNGLTSGARPDDRRQTSAVVANGQSEILNDELVDGLDNNERIIGGIGVRPSIEAIKEINVQTNNYSAEVGRTGGAVINIVTKSGTNAFHGSVYEFFENDALNATPYEFGATQPNGQPLPKPELRQNQFGGSLGGPIVKNKLFFFGDYEGLRQVLGQNPQTFQTLLPSQYETLHSGNMAAISSLLADGGPIDPVGLNYALLYPLANTPANPSNPNTQGFTASPVTTRNSDTYDGRVDWQIDQKDLIYGRYTYNNVPSNFPGLFPITNLAGLNIAPGGAIFNYYGQAVDKAQNAQINFVRTISPNLLLQLGFGFTRVNNQSLPLNYGVNVDDALGLPGINLGDATTSGLTPASTAGYGDIGDGAFIPIKDIDNTFQENGSLTINHGKHSIKVGAALIRRQAENLQNNYGIGDYTFNALNQDATGLAALLQGNFANVQRSNDLVTPHYREWEPDVFIQDDFRAASNLTLNIGLRYEVLTPFTEINNALTNFDPVKGVLLVAGQNGVNKYAGLNPTYSNFGPRFGFAYTPRPNLVLRGGYGMSYFQGNYTSNGSEKSQPFVSDYQCNNGSCPVNPATGIAPTRFAQGLPAPTASSATDPSGSVNGVLNAGFRTSYLEQFNLGVERSFGVNVLEITYVGELGRHLAQITNDQNVPALISNTALEALARQQGTTTAAAFNSLRPYQATLPNATQVSQFTSTGASNYQALQISLTRRAAAGLTIGANYTWAHSLDNVLGYSNEVNDGYGAVPGKLSTIEYGNSDLDLRNRLNFTANYELPFGKNLKGLAGLAGKGWQANTLLRWSSGLPFTVLQNNGVVSTTFGSTGNSRPNQNGKANKSGFDLNEFFDTSAFQPQTSGTLGSESRNSLYGPHFRQVDLSIFKTFPVYKTSTLEFRIEAFNIVNTTNFANPNNTLSVTPNTLTVPNYAGSGQTSDGNGNITQPGNHYSIQSSSFGQITSASANYVPRQIQFALKYQF